MHGYRQSGKVSLFKLAGAARAGLNSIFPTVYNELFSPAGGLDARRAEVEAELFLTERVCWGQLLPLKVLARAARRAPNFRKNSDSANGSLKSIAFNESLASGLFRDGPFHVTGTCFPIFRFFRLPTMSRVSSNRVPEPLQCGVVARGRFGLPWDEISGIIGSQDADGAEFWYLCAR